MVLRHGRGFRDSLLQRELCGRRVQERPFLQDLSCDASGAGCISCESQGLGTLPFAVAYSQVIGNSRILAIADEEGFVSCINTDKPLPATLDASFEGRRVQAQWSAHSNAVFDLCWTQGDTRLLTASGDKTVAMWDTVVGSRTAVFAGHKGSVKSCRTWNATPCVIASGGRDGCIQVWDMRNSSRSRTAEGDHLLQPIQTITESLTCRMIDMQEAHKLPAKRVAKRRRTQLEMHHPQGVTSVLFLNDGVTLASSGATDGCVKLWDMRQLREPREATAFSISAGSVVQHRCDVPAAAAQGQSAATAEPSRRCGIAGLQQPAAGSGLLASVIDGGHYLLNASVSGLPLQAVFQGHAPRSFFVKAAFSPDGTHLLSGSADHNAYIWQVNRPAAQPYVLSGHEGEVTAVAWCPTDLCQVTTCGDDGVLRVWKVHRPWPPRTVQVAEPPPREAVAPATPQQAAPTAGPRLPAATPMTALPATPGPMHRSALGMPLAATTPGGALTAPRANPFAATPQVQASITAFLLPATPRPARPGVAATAVPAAAAGCPAGGDAGNAAGGGGCSPSGCHATAAAGARELAARAAAGPAALTQRLTAPAAFDAGAASHHAVSGSDAIETSSEQGGMLGDAQGAEPSLAADSQATRPPPCGEQSAASLPDEQAHSCTVGSGLGLTQPAADCTTPAEAAHVAENPPGVAFVRCTQASLQCHEVVDSLDGPSCMGSLPNRQEETRCSAVVPRPHAAARAFNALMRHAAVAAGAAVQQTNGDGPVIACGPVASAAQVVMQQEAMPSRILPMAHLLDESIGEFDPAVRSSVAGGAIHAGHGTGLAAAAAAGTRTSRMTGSAAALSAMPPALRTFGTHVVAAGAQLASRTDAAGKTAGNLGAPTDVAGQAGVSQVERPTHAADDFCSASIVSQKENAQAASQVQHGGRSPRRPAVRQFGALLSMSTGTLSDG